VILLVSLLLDNTDSDKFWFRIISVYCLKTKIILLQKFCEGSLKIFDLVSGDTNLVIVT